MFVHVPPGILDNERVISRTTVQRVTNLELGTCEVKQRCMEYDKRLTDIIKDDNHTIEEQQDERQLQEWDGYTEDNHTEFATQFNAVISDSSIPEVDETFTLVTFHDTYLNKKLALTRGANDNCDVQVGKVRKAAMHVMQKDNRLVWQMRTLY